MGSGLIDLVFQELRVENGFGSVGHVAKSCLFSRASGLDTEGALKASELVLPFQT